MNKSVEIGADPRAGTNQKCSCLELVDLSWGSGHTGPTLSHFHTLALSSPLLPTLSLSQWEKHATLAIQVDQ